MSASVLKIINALFQMVDTNWQPTDNIPDLLIEGAKEILPVILALLGTIKASSAIAASNTSAAASVPAGPSHP